MAQFVQALELSRLYYLAAVKLIAAKTLIGSIDQASDSTDFRDNLRERAKLKALYG